MTITFNSIYAPACAYLVTLRHDKLNTIRTIRVLCPGHQYLDNIRGIFKARGLTMLNYDLMTQN